jgi:hypothetical protein
MLLSIIIGSCTKDIVATDISKKTMSILAPANAIHTPYNSITFWWEEVKDADKYQLQIVSPSFSNAINMIADTSVTGTKLTMILNPGSYEWRIRATNNAGSTAYTTRSFIIDTSNNMTNITVALLSPADSAYSSVYSQTFSWSPVFNATQYKVEVLNSTGGTLTSSVTTSTSFAYTFIAEGTYSWRVRAENQYTNSGFSTNTLFIDRTAPSAPVPLSPANTATLSLNDSLKWSTGSGGYYDSLLVATDSANFNSIVVREKMSAKYFKVTSAAGFANNNNNVYYWKLSTTDKAGNTSPYSVVRKFRIP